MRVIVDADVCAATGYCAELAPTVFRLPESGSGSVEVIDSSPRPEMWGVVLEAEGLCPTQAISTRHDN